MRIRELDVGNKRLNPSRRFVLRLGACLWPFAIVRSSISFARLPFEELDFDSLQLFASQSGNPGYTPICAVGVLAVEDVDREINQIKILRNKNEFTRRLKFAGSDERKKAYALSIIDHFFENRMLFFANVSSGDWPKTNQLREIRYNRYYKETFKQFVSGDVEFSLIVTRQNSTNIAQDTVEMLARDMEVFNDVALQRFGDNDFLQLTGFLTSCVRAEFLSNGEERKDPGKKTGKQKMSYINRLRKHLNVNSLTDDALRSHDKFQVKIFR